ncbi:hypothetical protein HQ560_15160 [bacterium]|nr:hypothetical protein [bacterium]
MARNTRKSDKPQRHTRLSAEDKARIFDETFNAVYAQGGIEGSPSQLAHMMRLITDDDDLQVCRPNRRHLRPVLNHMTREHLRPDTEEGKLPPLPDRIERRAFKRAFDSAVQDAIHAAIGTVAQRAATAADLRAAASMRALTSLTLEGRLAPADNPVFRLLANQVFVTELTISLAMSEIDSHRSEKPEDALREKMAAVLRDSTGFHSLLMAENMNDARRIHDGLRDGTIPFAIPPALLDPLRDRLDDPRGKSFINLTPAEVETLAPFVDALIDTLDRLADQAKGWQSKEFAAIAKVGRLLAETSPAVLCQILVAVTVEREREAEAKGQAAEPQDEA